MKEIVKLMAELDPRIRVQVEFIEKGVIMDIFIDGRWKITIAPKSFKKAKEIALQYRTIDAIREELHEEAARSIQQDKELDKLLEELFPELPVDAPIFNDVEQFIKFVREREDTRQKFGIQ